MAHSSSLTSMDNTKIESDVTIMTNKMNLPNEFLVKDNLLKEVKEKQSEHGSKNDNDVDIDKLLASQFGGLKEPPLDES